MLEQVAKKRHGLPPLCPNTTTYLPLDVVCPGRQRRDLSRGGDVALRPPIPTEMVVSSPNFVPTRQHLQCSTPVEVVVFIERPRALVLSLAPMQRQVLRKPSQSPCNA